MRTLVILGLLGGTARAGELDLDLGAQATTTAWHGDHGGGATLDLGYWFRPWLGASFVSKEQYATVDDRFMSYFSVNVSARTRIQGFRLTGELGGVHQHEEPRAAVMEQPVQSLFGVGDGIRHRMGARAAFEIAYPIHSYQHGELYAGFQIDATLFMDTDRGPQWMTSAGLSLGFSYDFARGP